MAGAGDLHDASGRPWHVLPLTPHVMRKTISLNCRRYVKGWLIGEVSQRHSLSHISAMREFVFREDFALKKFNEPFTLGRICQYFFVGDLLESFCKFGW